MSKSLKQNVVKNKKAAISAKRETENQHRKHLAEQFRFGFDPKPRVGRPKGTRRTLWLWMESDVIDAIQKDAVQRGIKLGDWIEAAALYVLSEGIPARK